MAYDALGNVLIAEPFDERGVDVLRRAGAGIVSCVGSPPEALYEALADARGLIVRSETRVDRALLERAPKLEVVARAGVGVDAIDVDAATSAGIVVVNTPGANSIAATELTFAMMLAAMRNVCSANASVRSERWERKPFIGRELYGKTLGIVGFGRIGSAVASRAAAFGMRVIACDPYVPAARARAADVELTDLRSILERADIVTLHVPLTPQTRGMIDAAALAHMQPHALLVNCARGSVVDPAALLSALNAEHISGAAIDVVPQEPPPRDSASARLLAHPRVVATPHIGGSTREALERIALELARDVVNVLAGRPARGAVNAPAHIGGDVERSGAFVDLAFRSGRLMPQLFDETLEEIVLGLHGDIAELDDEPFVAAALAGVLPLVTDRRVSAVNARDVAAELGVRVTVQRESRGGAAPALLVLASAGHRIAGTLLGAGPRLVEIDGFELDAVPSGTLLVTRHRDVPGMVGRVGTALGDAGVNISTMHVARRDDGSGAMMLLGVDREPSREVLNQIAAIAGVETVRSARL